MATRASVGRGLRQSHEGTIDSTTLGQVAPPVGSSRSVTLRGESLAVHPATSLSGSSPVPRLPTVLHPPPAPASGLPSHERTLRSDTPAVSGTGRYRVQWFATGVWRRADRGRLARRRQRDAAPSSDHRVADRRRPAGRACRDHFLAVAERATTARAHVGDCQRDRAGDLDVRLSPAEGSGWAGWGSR